MHFMHLLPFPKSHVGKQLKISNDKITQNFRRKVFSVTDEKDVIMDRSPKFN